MTANDEPGDLELLIVWWSLTGGSRQLARAVAEGAMRAGKGSHDDPGAADAARAVRVRLMRAEHATAGDLLSASGYVFAAPENLASMAGPMKAFFDRTYYAVLDRLNGRPYAVLVCAGSDGQGAVRQIERIATGWRLRQVAPSMIVCTNAQTPERIFAPKTIQATALERAAALGEALAAGLSMGIW